MPSIFQSLTEEKQGQLADVIVTSVFMGLVEERLAEGLQVFIGYGGGYEGYTEGGYGVQQKPEEEKDRKRHGELRTALLRKFPGKDHLLIIGAANQWVDASKREMPQDVSTSSFVITGAQSSKQVHVPMSHQAKSLALDCLNSNRYQSRNPAPLELNEERGAYYGVADLKGGEVYGPISTTRQIFLAHSGRWMKPSHGWILGPDKKPASGSYARMEGTEGEKALAKALAGDQKGDYVVGYCHGMIFAEHIVTMHGGGTAYEVSMNKDTCKNASCFGCSTFMFANGMPPSWMHLGKAESWAPLPERAEEFDYSAHFPRKLVVDTAVRMNTAWALAVANWMKLGNKYVGGSPMNGMLRMRLKSSADAMLLSNWFLDALMIHKSDIDRIIDVLLS